jgi:bacterial/archaeal transporter family-2 protein
MSQSIAVYAAWAALSGALIPVMAALNGTLGRSIGSPIHASLVAVLLATLAVGLLLLAVRPTAPASEAIRTAPPIAWFGGLAMAFYALSATFLTPRFGVGNFVMCVVLAQLVMSSLIDQFGWFGAPMHPIDLKRAAGLALLGAGAVLVAVR